MNHKNNCRVTMTKNILKESLLDMLDKRVPATNMDSIERSYFYDCVLHGGYQMIKRRRISMTEYRRCNLKVSARLFNGIS